MMKFNIIGAGIGGLTAGIALKRKGFSVQLFEQATAFKPVGAGIFLANNAMQVYEKLGLKNEIEKAGIPIHSLKITKPDLSPLSIVDLTYFEKKYGVSNIAIHRGALLEILLNQFEKEEILLNKKIVGIEPANFTKLKFSDKSVYPSEITIAADGIHSIIRKTLFPESKIRYANQICWRGVTKFDLPKKFKYQLNEAWGVGNRFGFGEIAPNQIYWYALTDLNESVSNFDKSDIAEIFQNYHPIVSELINSTLSKQIHTDQISDLKPTSKWFQKNICLIGDAAHATTPNMGQGACQAIEDAYVLAECLNRNDVLKGFQQFQDLRRSKVNSVVKGSWMIGKMAHLNNPTAVHCRNLLLKLTPSYLNRKQSENIFKLVQF